MEATAKIYAVYEYLTQQCGLSEPGAARKLFETGRDGHTTVAPGVVLVTNDGQPYVTFVTD